MEAVNGKFSGTVTASTINGSIFVTTGTSYTTTIADGYITTTYVLVGGSGYSGNTQHFPGATSYQSGSNTTIVRASGITTPSADITTANIAIAYISSISNGPGSPSGQPIHTGNISSQAVNYATNAGHAMNADVATVAGSASNADYSRYLQRSGNTSVYVYVSSNNNFRPASDLMGSCGTSEGRWTSVYAYNGTIQTSDRREKTEISPLPDKHLQFARKLLKLPRIYKMIDGQSGRFHIGFIAQDVEEAMAECGITDMEFGGLVKSPVYAKKLLDENGNETDEYDTTSEIIDYRYWLRYEEFIPLSFALLAEILNDD